MIIKSFAIMGCKSSGLSVLTRPAVVADGDGSKVEITNLDTWLSIPLDVKVSGYLDIGLLKRSKDFGLSVLPLEANTYEEYPQIPATLKPRQKYPIGPFAAIDAEVLETTAADTTRPVLCGVLFDAEHNVMVSTDGHRLRTVPLELGKVRSFILSVPTLYLVIAAEANGWKLQRVDKCTKSKDDTVGWFRFTWTNGAELYAKEVEGPYPDYCKVMPTAKHLIKLTQVERAQFAAAVEAVCPAAAKPASLVQLGEDGVVYAYDRDKGIAWSSPLPFKAQFDIGFNAIYLLDLLNGLPEGGLTIGFSTQIAGCTFAVDKHPTVEGGLAMLMPLRIIIEDKPEAKTFVSVAPKVPETKGLQRLATFRKGKAADA